MDFRLIPPVSSLDKFNGQIVFKIPVLLKKVFLEKAKGQTVPVLFERLDFKSGNMITTAGITFKKSLSLFEDLGKILPFETSAMVYWIYWSMLTPLKPN